LFWRVVCSYVCGGGEKKEQKGERIIYYCRLHGPEGRSPTFGHVNLGFGEYATTCRRSRRTVNHPVDSFSNRSEISPRPYIIRTQVIRTYAQVHIPPPPLTWPLPRYGRVGVLYSGTCRARFVTTAIIVVVIILKTRPSPLPRSNVRRNVLAGRFGTTTR